MANVGYDDTPQLPGREWLVHDGSRPQPRVVTPGAETMTYREAAIFAPRLISGRPPQLCLESRWIRPDDRMATLVGRELFGLPKRVGEVLLEDRFTEVRHVATSFRLSWERRSDFHHLEVASE